MLGLKVIKDGWMKIKIWLIKAIDTKGLFIAVKEDGIVDQISGQEKRAGNFILMQQRPYNMKTLGITVIK